ARDEHRLFPRHLQLREGLGDRLENGVVTASRAPAHLLVGGIVLGRQHRGGHGVASRRARIAAVSSPILNGLPVTLFKPSAGMRKVLRSIVTSWPVFISGTSTCVKPRSR